MPSTAMHDEPGQHDRAEGAADRRRAERLHARTGRPGSRSPPAARRSAAPGAICSMPFERREHRDRRRDRAVAVDQRRAEQADRDDDRPRCRFLTPSSVISAMMPPSPSLSTRMAKLTYLTVVIRTSVHRISDRAPSTRRRIGMRAGVVEHGFQRVERARADVAEHHAERGEAGERETPVRVRLCLGGLARHVGFPPRAPRAPSDLR